VSKDQENSQETEQVPFEANIEKTEKLDGEQVKTEQPSLNLAEQVKPSEVVSGAHVAENSAAPPIDSSIALPDQQTSAVPDAVQASSISDHEVVDGTTIYFDAPPPKINEAPSLENVTPEAISPTMTQARAQPTESIKTPEIESSVQEHLDVTEKIETAVLSDNPGAVASTGNEVETKSENMDSTEPLVDELKTASYDLGAKDTEHAQQKNIGDQIQVDKPIMKENEETKSNEEEDINEDDYIGSEEVDDSDEDYEYVDEKTEEERMKIRQKIEEMKDKAEETIVDDKNENASEEAIEATDEAQQNSDIIDKIPDGSQENEQVPYDANLKHGEHFQKEDVAASQTESVENFSAGDHPANTETSQFDTEESRTDLTDHDSGGISAQNENEEIYEKQDNINEKLSHDGEKQSQEDESLHSHDLGHGLDHEHSNDHETEHSHEVEHSHDTELNHQHEHDDDMHGHNHGHGHSHSHGHGHSHSHGHGHSHDHGHDHSHNHGHAHSHNHGHGHSHSHGHGHSHSHDDHDHSHGIGHLGKGVHQRVPEEIPQHYKPAEQKFELPLSAQFGTPSTNSYSGEYTTTTSEPMAQTYDQYMDTDSQFSETTGPTTNTPYENGEETHTTISSETYENEKNENYYTPSPAEQIEEDSYTPLIETTPAPPIDSENGIPVEKEEVVEESGGIFAAISNFFSSEPDKALQDAINTPPEIEIDLKGEVPGIHHDNLDAKLNDAEADFAQTNTNDNANSDKPMDSIDEQIDGDGYNSMNTDNTVVEEEVKVEPAGKEIDISFTNNDEMIINESTEKVETVEDNTENLSIENVDSGFNSEQPLDDEVISTIQSEEPVPVTEDSANAAHQPLQSEQDFSGTPLPHTDNLYQDGPESTGSTDKMVPEWLTVIAHEQGYINSERISLVGIIAITLLLLHFINMFMDRSTREKPLIKKIAEMDRKLFAATNEVLILRKEMADGTGSSGDSLLSSQHVREKEMELEQVKLELETSRRAVEQEGERSKITLNQLEVAQQELRTAQEEARQSQEMVEELLSNQKDKAGTADDKLMEVVQQLQTQLENQKNMLQKYEPKLKKKEKENKEMTKQLKQMRADVANANLETEKIRKEMIETSKTKEELSSKLDEISKNEEEWKSLTDLLQSQLDEKSESVGHMETEIASLKSRISVFKNEAESKEEQLEILQETLDELQNRKVGKKENLKDEDGEGWDVDEEGWEVEDMNEVKELAKLRVENKKYSELKDSLQQEIADLKNKFEAASVDLEKYKTEASSLREARDEVIKEQTDVQRRLDVLTEFFNKKEAELQKQLGLQSARFGDVSTDAESTARQLISVTTELEATQEQLKIVKSELEDQERSLKASVASQEKKAHENWVAARQAERKLTELQGEMSLMRNKLTIVESKNTLLEQEKEDLTETVNTLKTSVKADPGPKLKNVSFAPDTTDPDSDSEFDCISSSSARPNHVTANGVHTSGSLDSLQLGQGDVQGSGPNSVTSASIPTSPSGPESLPPLPGLPGISSLNSSIPNPGMPGMTGMPMLPNPLNMVPPLFSTGTMLPGMPPMMEMRQPPLGRMSPGPRDRSNRSFSSRSPSPEYERYRGGSGRYSNRDRDMSPSSRSERRMSPGRRGPSPTRSERNYRDRQYQPDYNRDRYYNNSNRDTSPDRYSTRSERSERESPRDSQRYRDRTGPKTSTPGEASGRSYRA